MKQLPSIDTTSDTFLSWIVKTNAIITLANTEMVTANSHANGAITTGKGYVIGSFGSNTIVCDTIRGGNTVAQGNLTITSNAIFTDTVVRVDKGITYANTLATGHAVRLTTSTTATQNVDTFAATSFRTAKYVISVTDPVNSKFQSTEIMLMHDGTNTYTTEYATLTSNTTLATFTSDITGGNVRLLVTPAVANVQINVARTLISS